MPGAVPCEARWGTSLLSLSCEHRGTHNWKGPTSISQSVRRLRTDLPERTHQVAAAHRRVGGGAGAGRGGGGGAVQVRGRSHADPPRPRPRSSRGAKVSEAGGGGSFGVRCLREISPFFRSQEVLPPPTPRVLDQHPHGQRAVAPLLLIPVTDAELRACQRGSVPMDGAGRNPAVDRRFGGAAREPSEQGLGDWEQPPSRRWSALRPGGSVRWFDPREAAGADPAWPLGGLSVHRGFFWAGR